MTKEQWSRRELLQGGAGLALGLTVAGCGVGQQEKASKAATERVVKAEPTATSSTSTGPSTSSRS